MLSYGGYRVEVTREEEEDNVKLWHELIRESDGLVVEFIDWNPYHRMTARDLEMYIKAGRPNRERVGTIGPLNSELLEAYIERS